MYDTLAKDPKGVLSVFDHEPIPIEPDRPDEVILKGLFFDALSE